MTSVSQSSDNPLIITDYASLENILNTATGPIYVVFNTESMDIIDELISDEKLQMTTENIIRLIKPTIG